MKKTLLILKNEFFNTVTRRSFLLTLFLVPLVSILVTVFISTTKQAGSSTILNQIVSPPQKAAVEGYVDESNLIKLIPAWLDQSSLIAFPSRDSADQALKTSQITGYYVILSDYIKTGNILYIVSNYNPLSESTRSQTFEELLTYNLLNGNNSLTSLVENPIYQLQTTSYQTTQPQREENNPLTYFLPYIVTMLFYIIILTAASLMLNSITTEKQNRVMEVLMVSVTPTQILSGKIIALGLIGLIQTIVWTGTGYGILALGKNALNLSAAFQLPFSILIWGLVFFLLGYALYASFMAGVGALVPNLREASQATTMMIIPLIIPLLVLNVLISDPNGSLSVFLSLFPLTSPVAMMTRLSTGVVPLWQIMLSMGILVVSAYLAVRAIAGMFRAQTLLQGQEFKISLFIKALVGKI